MVIIRAIRRYILLFFLLMATISGFAAEAPPTPAEIASAAKDVGVALVKLKASLTPENMDILYDRLNVFKGYVLRVGQSIDRHQGGAATPKALASYNAISDLGTELANAVFAFREDFSEQIEGASPKSTPLNKEDVYNLEQDVEDMMVDQLYYPLHQLSFFGLRHKVDERSNVDGIVTVSDVMRRTAFEVARDITNFFSGGRNRFTGEYFYTPLEAIRRERLISQDIKNKMNQAKIQVPFFNRRYDSDLIYEEENHEERLGGMLLALTDRAVNIKVERNSAQKYAKLFWAVSGTLLSVPVFNYLGNSYTAHLESSIVTASVFTTIYTLKYLSSSVKSTAEWIEFSRFVRKEMAEGLIKSSELYLKKQFPTEYYPAQIPNWLQRRIAIREHLTKNYYDPSARFVTTTTQKCAKALKTLKWPWKK